MLIKKISLVVFFLGIFLISCKQGGNQDKVIETTSDTVKQLPYFNTPDFTPKWLPEINDLKNFHKISSFSFKSQLNEEINNNRLLGSIYVANFFFTSCPSICIQLTENMGVLQNFYAEDDEVKLISYSVMPSVDTVEVLKSYGELHDIDPKKWYLVTGDKSEIYDLAREAYFADDLYKQTNDKSRFVHTENLLLIDKKGHIRGVYKGTEPAEVKRIQRHIKILKKEK